MIVEPGCIVNMNIHTRTRENDIRACHASDMTEDRAAQSTRAARAAKNVETLRTNHASGHIGWRRRYVRTERVR